MHHLFFRDLLNDAVSNAALGLDWPAILRTDAEWYRLSKLGNQHHMRRGALAKEVGLALPTRELQYVTQGELAGPITCAGAGSSRSDKTCHAGSHRSPRPRSKLRPVDEDKKATCKKRKLRHPAFSRETHHMPLTDRCRKTHQWARQWAGSTAGTCALHYL